MIVKIKVEKEVNIKTLEVSAGVRYWEDATVNGVEDIDGDLIPCRNDDRWCPVIDLETGKITNWIEGKEADIHYKVCDDGSYILKDENGDKALELDGYVPSIMCPSGNGYGDYIVMNINANGQIENWEADITDFQDGED